MRTEPRVLLDATAIPAERGGVGRYVDNLVEALDAAGAALSVVCQSRDADVFARLAPHSRIIPTAEELGSRPARLAWEQTTLPRLANRLPVDVIHSPHYTMPLAASVPGRRHPARRDVLLRPRAAPGRQGPVLPGLDPDVAAPGRGLRGAQQGDGRRAGPATRTPTPDSMVVAYHGVDHDGVPGAASPSRSPRPRPSWASATERGSPSSARWSRARTCPALVRAYIRAMTTARRIGPRWCWPARRAGIPAVEPAVAAVPAGMTVLRPGHLPVELLPGLLGGAQVVAYPSLGEGFGLPVLEAMACGAAVLTTRKLVAARGRRRRGRLHRHRGRRHRRRAGRPARQPGAPGRAGGGGGRAGQPVHLGGQRRRHTSEAYDRAAAAAAA